MMLLHPAVFYSGARAAPGRRWREHTAVIRQVARENSARQADLAPFTESNSFSIIFMQTAGGGVRTLT